MRRRLLPFRLFVSRGGLHGLGNDLRKLSGDGLRLLRWLTALVSERPAPLLCPLGRLALRDDRVGRRRPGLGNRLSDRWMLKDQRLFDRSLL